AREPKGADGQRPGAPESLRWKEGYERVADLASALPDTRLVYVADREADILELMVRARDLGTPADWLLRAKHNRALPGGEGKKLWTSVLETKPLGEVRFSLPSGRGRKAREVRQELYAKRVTLSDRRQGHLEATCVIAREIGAPEGVKPIEWRLLTNRRAETLDAAVALIDWYRARWEIELLFLVLKEGCRVEALQLGTVERLERAFALFLVVGWRITRLMR
ncbi:IS4 family transposase, partial [Thiorhodococcus fuscus]